MTSERVMMATMTLTEFLLARIAEDEATSQGMGADAMTGWRWKHLSQPEYERAQGDGLRLAKRMWAEAEAKRRIVTTVPELEGILAAIAAIYADHPDYDQAWRP